MNQPPLQPEQQPPQFRSQAQPPPAQPGYQSPQYPQWQQPMPYPPQVPPPQMAPQKPKSRKRLWLIIAIVVLALIVIGSVASQAGNNSQPATTSQQPQQTSQPTQVATKAAVTPTPAHKFRTFSDGMFAVGKDIQPGTYRTRVGSTNCYYARLKDFDTNAIISNNNTDDPAVVTILPTDKAFQSQDCGTWTTDLSAITSSKTTFSNGIFIVGTDIIPGIYKNSTSLGCYYARLSAFDTNAIISNANTDAVAIVTIAASDKGFQSHNCGTWTKQ